MKKVIMAVFPIVIMVLLIMFPQTALDGAGYGIEVWTKHLVPTLFPFSVAANLLVKTGITEYFGDLSAIIIGAVAGYPVGASVSADMYKKGAINTAECERLTIFSAFCSPLFMLNTVGTMIGSNARYIILFAHYVAQVAIFFLYNAVKGKNERKKAIIDKKTKSFGKMLSESIASGVKGMLTIGGYLVVFSVIMSFLPENVKLFASVFCEMSGGIYTVALSSVSFEIKTALSAFGVTFGGLCIIMQINGFTDECGVSVIKTALWRFGAGITAGIIAYLMTIFFI